MAEHRSPLPNVMEFERKLDWFSKTDRPKAHVFDGLVTALQLQKGLGLHTLNATARQSFEVDGQRKPGAVLHCFLEGSTEAALAGKPMNLGRRQGDPVKLVLTSIGESQRFTRRSRPNEYVRKISIQMSHDWLDQNGLALPEKPKGGSIHRIEWVANIDEIRTLEQLALTPGFSTPVARLQAEAMSLGLVARCFEDFSEQPGAADLTAREQAQMRRIEEFACQPGPLPSLQQLAAEGGLSQSGLRRLIQATHGRSPLAHVRQLRLGLAREALEESRVSVEQAAALAGYGSAANFSTAFRRAFGTAPSKVRHLRNPN
ncbi:helix-turn-helix domain-containing protein [Phaeobacter gallaeciensis]|uniref:Transcriptional regulator n=1 Tax=Phaeobacter gallaeciensis TaxID=60890 RepID=A0AAC9ZCZ8_9RHOB|nr:AraC family transcriptional regulator [Phaeobacter gallaeciensis]AHD11552.1 Transcriptional regulator [Phaeobacter gallaeciensis DSM 26640]ATE94816.1 Transcriptional regulator [Phaeobacter gallaeciensis]ATE99088.1 Transcriptional regulator [Phaeobacter gallaeciensis]ATF03480.1 Transcriptional regulator [Phaeobacter gallaeciensis]ATF07860.1 Transcriptional regulator [Phaeobacter gallaeciensis]